MKLPKELEIAKSYTAPIVQVDDDDVLIKIIQRYHGKSGVQNPYLPFLNGDEFLDHLKSSREKKEELPLIILLDINMPGKDGFEVLQEIRSIEDYKEIPLCSMLSSSTYEEDIEKSKKFGANSYIVKPDNAREYIEFFDDIAEKIKV